MLERTAQVREEVPAATEDMAMNELICRVYKAAMEAGKEGGVCMIGFQPEVSLGEAGNPSQRISVEECHNDLLKVKERLGNLGLTTHSVVFLDTKDVRMACQAGAVAEQVLGWARDRERIRYINLLGALQDRFPNVIFDPVALAGLDALFKAPDDGEVAALVGDIDALLYRNQMSYFAPRDLAELQRSALVRRMSDLEQEWTKATHEVRTVLRGLASLLAEDAKDASGGRSGKVTKRVLLERKEMRHHVERLDSLLKDAINWCTVTGGVFIQFSSEVRRLFVEEKVGSTQPDESPLDGVAW